MNEEQPAQEDFLQQLRAEREPVRGRLRIFFGYAPGVGKTYSMLEHAKRAQNSGRDIVVGYIEPHARPATLNLMNDLEVLPPVATVYRGIPLRELDLDAALKRKPEILLVDELAHSNAPESRHIKRWQDVEELLSHGIDIWTTLNVQHLESLNDVIGQITGVQVRETVPDQVLESANEIELVDLPPDDLLDRLHQGQIYHPEQVSRALEKFFRRSNLSALRELSLRQTARRIHSDVEVSRQQQAITQPWETCDRLLVCVGPSPTTAKVIRTAKRLATALDASWIAASVELPGMQRSEVEQESIAQHFRLAEGLGAETITLSGESVASSIIDFARTRNATKILIGRTKDTFWQRLGARSIVDKLINASSGIDVYVIQGSEETVRKFATQKIKRNHQWSGYALAVGITCSVAALAWLLAELHLAEAEANTVMLFLAGIAFVAFRCGAGPALLASVLSVLTFDFFFVPPYYTFAIADARYLVTFGVMLAIGLMISSLAARLRTQIANARRREQRAQALYELGKELSSLYGEVFLLHSAAKKIGELMGVEVAVYMRRAAGVIELAFSGNLATSNDPIAQSAAKWSIENEQFAGSGTNTLPNARGLFVPLQGSQSCLGCLSVQTRGVVNIMDDPESRRLLEACCHQLALAIERDQLAIDASKARMKMESEHLRNTLLSGISHDLRTPLAAIAGATSTVLEYENLDIATRRELLQSVSEETFRLTRILENILQMTRLDGEAISPRLQYHVVEEMVGTAIQRCEKNLNRHIIATNLPENLPLVFVDGILFEQVLINLLENAGKYAPSGTVIGISAQSDHSHITIEISDSGPGVPVGTEERIFEKFYRCKTQPDSGVGHGLGLAICRAILTILGGSIVAMNRPEGGITFRIQLPVPPSPSIPTEYSVDSSAEA